MSVGVVSQAKAFSFGIDTVTVCSSDQLKAMRDDPVTPIKFVALYMGGGGWNPTYRDLIFSLGLGISPVTFSRASGWTPSSQEGAVDGAGDVARLTSLACPLGVTVWTDLEGCSGTVQTTQDWCNARGKAQQAGGWMPGLYVGAAQALNGVQLASLVQSRYWEALSIIRAPGMPLGSVVQPSSGWCQKQLPHTTVLGGATVDINVVFYDWQNRLPTIWMPS